MAILTFSPRFILFSYVLCMCAGLPVCMEKRQIDIESESERERVSETERVRELHRCKSVSAGCCRLPVRCRPTAFKGHYGVLSQYFVFVSMCVYILDR